MLLYVLPLLDLISVIIIVLLQFDILGIRAAIFAAFYLIGKGVVFRDTASIIDMMIGIFIFFIAAGFHTILTWIAVIYLLQKIFLAVINY